MFETMKMIKLTQFLCSDFFTLPQKHPYRLFYRSCYIPLKVPMSFSSSSPTKYHRTSHCEDDHDGNGDGSVSHTKKTRDFPACY